MSRKAEWQTQHDAIVDRVLQLLADNEDVSISQEGYKGDFFAVFADAYRTHFCTPRRRYDETARRLVDLKEQRPIVHGDHFWYAAKERNWIADVDVEKQTKRYRDLRTVQNWWNEWKYAWDRNPPPERRKRGNS